MIRLHNTLGNKVEEFKPLKEGFVGMYSCGPTVYDYVHIGNLRSFILSDLVRRTFEYEGYEVKQVMNITDLGHLSGDGDEGEDKMTKGLKREGKPVTMEAMKELADFYTERFKEDLEKLNIETPAVFPKASEHIPEQIELIKELEAKGFTYTTSDGVYFDTSKDPHYGKLIRTSDGQSRIGENSEKRNQKDFALWKFNTEMGWDSPWIAPGNPGGKGFPGWHIECSAMSQKYLGKTFDLHTGGIDLAPIHHNNEIAQSENACGCDFAHYWLHNEFVNLQGEKMAKSEGNILTLNTLIEKGYSPLAYRYFLLLSHYRTQTNFTWEALDAAQSAYRKLKEFVSTKTSADKSLVEQSDPKTFGTEAFQREFKEAIENDLNTPEALAVVWKLIKDENVSDPDKRALLLDFDRVLGLKLDDNEFEVKDIPSEVQTLLDERAQARADKDFAKSDELREQIKKLGFDVLDTTTGQELR